MLLVAFHAGEERFGIDSAEVVEILPLVRLAPVQHAPDWVAGLFNSRGTVAPVLDTSAMLTGRPARKLLSTRILLVSYPCPCGAGHLLGLAAERVLETVSCSPADVQPPGIAAPGAPYLGGVLAEGEGLLRRITVAELLRPGVRELLFSSCGGQDR